VFSEIAIVVDEGNPPRFDLTEGGSPPRLATVAVVDIDTDEPIWLLVSDSFTTVLPFTIHEVTPEEVDARADEEPIDPIEDLPPSDPRHREAIAARDSVNDAAFPVLGTLTYGVVPPGFRQASPGAGVVALVPGRSYNLFVMGPGGHGSVAFQAK
jgi:hypothetical protein